MREVLGHERSKIGHVYNIEIITIGSARAQYRMQRAQGQIEED
ncbi:hypothetical protein [Providencia rettgeri]|nr:hypothetical protein [Providencia rettgeri]